MSDPDTTTPAWVPQACTLPTAERPLRQAEFDHLFTTAVRTVERVSPCHLRLALAGGADLAAWVADLTARERECCSFFTFRLTASPPGALTLDIEVPPAHADVVAALAARAERAGRPR